MKTKVLLKYCIQFSIALIIVALIGCSKESDVKTPENQTQQTVENKDTRGLSIIRDKNVNVDSLDRDKDGSVYQCEMDYDVISDKPGTCPKCGMQLKKVSIADAKKYLNAFNGNE